MKTCNALTLIMSALMATGASAGCLRINPPRFISPPEVIQIDNTTVRVSWHNIVNARQCADQLLAEFWSAGNEKYPNTSKYVSTSTNHVDIPVIPNKMYTIRAVAREDHGLLGATFTSSSTVNIETTVIKQCWTDPPEEETCLRFCPCVDKVMNKHPDTTSINNSSNISIHNTKTYVSTSTNHVNSIFVKDSSNSSINSLVKDQYVVEEKDYSPASIALFVLTGVLLTINIGVFLAIVGFKFQRQIAKNEGKRSVSEFLFNKSVRLLSLTEIE